MRNFCLTTLLFIVIISPIHAQYDALLWRVSGHGIEKPSYLFGTIHIQDHRAFNFNDSVLVCLEKADAFATELLASELVSPQLIQAMMAPDGEKLNEILTDEEYHLAKQVFKEETGQNIETYNAFKPFAILAIMQQQIIAKDMPVALDIYLSNKAKELGKLLLAVEKLETQINVFNQFGKEEFLASINDLDSMDSIIEEIIVAYEKEDLDLVLKHLLEGSSDEYKDFEKHLITDRNTTMATSIAKIVTNQSTFIAIGSGHLPNNDGVIQRLKNKGFTVEPIKAPKNNRLKKPSKTISEESYTIVFPDAPHKETHKIPSTLGELDVTMYIYEESDQNADNLLFTFGYSTFPEVHTNTIEGNKVKLNEMYDGAVKQAFSAIGITSYQEVNIDFKGIPSRKAYAHIHGVFFEMKYIYHNKHLFFTQVASKETKKDNTEKTTFYNLLELK